ncbi:MAG: Chorismate mutase type [Pseudomonadota bacterium]|jgi:3-deoxy-7-phosphoheptulonate synthase/chorismate mutase
MPDPDELTRLRAEMDALNLTLRGLIQARARLARRIGAVKRAQGLTLYDPHREEAMLRALMVEPEDGLPSERLAEIIAEIIAACRESARHEDD